MPKKNWKAPHSDGQKTKAVEPTRTMHETAESLRSNIASAYGWPAHLSGAFGAWVESVEARLGGSPPPAPPPEKES